MNDDFYGDNQIILSLPIFGVDKVKRVLATMQIALTRVHRLTRYLKFLMISGLREAPFVFSPGVVRHFSGCYSIAQTE